MGHESRGAFFPRPFTAQHQKQGSTGRNLGESEEFLCGQGSKAVRPAHIKLALMDLDFDERVRGSMAPIQLGLATGKLT